MIRKIFTILPFAAALFFPWPLTAVLALGVAVYEPLIPLAVGLFADTLYYSPYGGALPFFSLAGAATTALAFLVRSQLKASIIGE
jgi:hypothetical protein